MHLVLVKLSLHCHMKISQIMAKTRVIKDYMTQFIVLTLYRP